MELSRKELRILRGIIRQCNVEGDIIRMEPNAIINQCYVDRLHKIEKKHLYPAMYYAIRDLQRRLLGRRRPNNDKFWATESIHQKFARQRTKLRIAQSLDQKTSPEKPKGKIDSGFELVDNKDLIDVIINESNLAQDEKDLIYCRYYEGLSMDEMSEKFKTAIPTIAYRMRKIFYELRRVAFSKVR